MPNKYDRPLFMALHELMKAELYDAVNRVLECAILESIPLDDENTENKEIPHTKTE